MAKKVFGYFWAAIFLVVCPWLGWYLATLVRESAQLWAAYAFISPLIAFTILTHIIAARYKATVEEPDRETDPEVLALVEVAALKLGYQSPVVRMYRDEQRKTILSLDENHDLRINRHLFDELSPGEKEFGILRTLSVVKQRGGNQIAWTLFSLVFFVLATGLSAYNPWLIIPVQAGSLVGMFFWRFSSAKTWVMRQDKLALELTLDRAAATNYITFEEKLSSTSFFPGLGLDRRLKALGL